MAEVTVGSASEPFVAVTWDGSDPAKIQTPDFDGQYVIGIVDSAFEAGENRTVDRDVGNERAYKWTAAESVSEGDKLAADTDGKAIVAEDGMYVGAIAYHDGEAGEQVEVIPMFTYPDEDFAVVVGAESVDTIPLTIQSADGEQHNIEAQLLEDNGGDTGLELVSDASGTGQDLTVGTDGTAVAGDGSKWGLFKTTASGSLDLDVNDNSGSLSGDRYVKLTMDGGSRTFCFEVTFA